MRLAVLACVLAVSLSPASLVAKPRPHIRCDRIHCAIDRAYRDELLSHEDRLWGTYQLRPVMRDGELDGFQLTLVQPRSPFWLVGLRAGDVIRAINDMRLDDAGRVLSANHALRHAAQVRVSLVRDQRPYLLIIDVE